MARLTFITGGARSGKSRYAESFLLDKDDVLYVATSIPFDDEMKERVKLHQNRRPASWGTLESYQYLSKQLHEHSAQYKYILIDCLTLMVSNLMIMNREVDWDKIEIDRVNLIEREIQCETEALLDFIKEYEGEVFVVSNEVGMGLVPERPLGRFFRDIAGRMNQIMAKSADNVILMVSGLPMVVKGKKFD